jgi:hypothetical protein
MAKELKLTYGQTRRGIEIIAYVKAGKDEKETGETI